MKVARTTPASSLVAAMATGALLLGGCGGDEESRPTGAAMSSADESNRTTSVDPALNEPPVVESVGLEPSQPRPGERISARVLASDPEGDPITLQYQWKVDGRVTDEIGSSLHVEGSVGKGSRIEVAVAAYDGTNRSAEQRASATVGNLPPVLHGVIIEPLGEINAGHDVVAIPKASDADGDPLSFEYRWAVNRVTVGDEGNRLAASNFERGDEITLVLTASDGMSTSEPLASDPIPVVNAAPKINSTPGGFDDLGRFTYEIEAVDPDGDSTFRYRMLDGPAGMEIDIVDGAVHWVPTESQAGRHPVKIEVKDAKGAVATQSFVMEVDFEDVPETSPAAAAER